MSRGTRIGRALALGLALGATAGWAAELTVEGVEVDSRTHEIRATNPNPYPVWVEVTFPELRNVSVSPEAPVRVQLPANSGPTRVATLRAVMRAGIQYSFQWEQFFGDPGATHDPAARYLFPFAHGEKFRLGQGYGGASSHQGEDFHSLDFDMDRRTPVHAARAGTVLEVVDDFRREGLPVAAGEGGNQVVVLHADGTFAVYCHLSRNTARVASGDQVRAGQVLGASGNTGSSSGPHLHFEVNIGNNNSIPVVMRGEDGSDLPARDLVEGRYYYSNHPGQPAFTVEHGHGLTDADFDGTDTPFSGHRRVELATEARDDTSVLWLENGTASDVHVDVTLSLTNMTSTKGRRYPVTVPANTRTYAGLVRPDGSGRAYRWRGSIRYRPLRGTLGR